MKILNIICLIFSVWLTGITDKLLYPNAYLIIGDIPVDLGEIYICYDICLKNAKKYGNSFDREFCFLFIHGLLHLLGYDHQTKEQEEVMFKLQDEILPPKEN